MKNLVKLFISIFTLLLFFGCGKEPEPVKDVLQKTAPLENFDDNWPPKEEKEQYIDLSEIQISEIGIDSKELQEFYDLPKTGASTIFGKIAIRTPTGQLVSGPYSNLYLIPQTSYSKKWFRINYYSGNLAIGLDNRVYDFVKLTKSNQKGDFSFSNIPKGRYYIIGVMNCGVDCGFDSNKSIRMVSEVIVNKDGSVLKNIIKSL